MMIFSKLWAKWLQIKKMSDNALLKIDGATGKEAQIEFLINGVSKGFLKCDSAGMLNFTEKLIVEKGLETLSGTINESGWQNAFPIAAGEIWEVYAQKTASDYSEFNKFVVAHNQGTTDIYNYSIGSTSCQISGNYVQLSYGYPSYDWIAIRVK